MSLTWPEGRHRSFPIGVGARSRGARGVLEPGHLGVVFVRDARDVFDVGEGALTLLVGIAREAAGAWRRRTTVLAKIPTGAFGPIGPAKPPTGVLRMSCMAM
jgi:hypothetical protein